MVSQSPVVQLLKLRVDVLNGSINLVYLVCLENACAVMHILYAIFGVCVQQFCIVCLLIIILILMYYQLAVFSCHIVLLAFCFHCIVLVQSWYKCRPSMTRDIFLGIL